MKITEVKKSGDEVVVYAEVDLKNESKPKGYIHWVSEVDAVTCETRLYDVLFKHLNPVALEDYISAINKDSLKTLNRSKMHKDLLSKVSCLSVILLRMQERGPSAVRASGLLRGGPGHRC